MRAKLFALFSAAALTAACSHGSPAGPSDLKPQLPSQPTNISVMQEFFQPISLSNDAVELTIEFDQAGFYPMPTSKIDPVPKNTGYNPCPPYCQRFTGKIVSGPTAGGGIVIYFSKDGVSKDQNIGNGRLSDAGDTTTFAQSGQVPLWDVYPYMIVEWEYFTIVGAKRVGGVKAIETHYEPK